MLAFTLKQGVTLVGNNREIIFMGKPFQQLGGKLRIIREQRRESLAEVSGAVEIDTDVLEKIESGEQRPSEDILLLLLSYFDVHDEEATSYWDLAGYNNGESEKSTGPSQQSTFDLNQPVAMLMPMDLRIVYTDMVHVMSNNFGIVMNFMQTAGPNNQPLAVARIGMSREHAQSVVDILQQTLAQANQPPKMLAPDNQSKDKNKK